MYVELSLTALGALLLLLVWRSHVRLRRAVEPRRGAGRLVSYPSVTVIRPIKGLDAGAEENIRRALETGYPGRVETLFVLDDEHEPAVSLVRRAIQERAASGQPVDARVVFCGQPPANQTGKLNAMIVGLRHASGDLVAFADSDIRPDGRALAALVETLLTEKGAGAAFAPVVATEPTVTVGDAGYALLLNGLYGAAAAAATRLEGGELPFIMGQFMVFRREAIEAIGGLEAAEGQLVDDMYLGHCLNTAGYRNVVAAHQVPIVQHGLALGEFASVYRRWITFSRTGLPGWSFKSISIMHGIVFWLGVVGAAAALAQGLWVALAATGLVPVALGSSLNRLHRSLGGARLPLSHAWVSAALLLVAPVVYLSIFSRRKVRWRGRSYELAADSRLAARAPTGSIPPRRARSEAA